LTPQTCEYSIRQRCARLKLSISACIRRTLTEEEKERQSAIAKEYIRNLWWRHNEISIDMDMKMEMRMEAITALPSEAMQLAALMTPQDPSVPIDYRAVLERPPAEGWHRPRVSQAAQDLADADDYFKAQAALDGAISGQGVTDADAAALGEGAELNEDGEKARRQSKSK
jgi:hypothetical protein